MGQLWSDFRPTLGYFGLPLSRPLETHHMLLTYRLIQIAPENNTAFEEIDPGFHSEAVRPTFFSNLTKHHFPVSIPRFWMSKQPFCSIGVACLDPWCQCFPLRFSSRFKLLKVPPGARQTAQAWFQHGRTPFVFGRILIQLESFHNGV